MSDDVLDLLETAPAPPMSIDPYAAVLGGRRRLRRRRARFAGAGLAAAAVVLAVLTHLPGNDDRALVPATPSAPTTGMTRSEAVLRSVGGRYLVRLDPRPDDPGHLAYLSLAPDGTESEIGGGSVTGLGDQPTYGHADGSDVILGVLPADAKNLSAFFGPDTDQNLRTTSALLPGTPYRAFAIGLLPPLTTDDLWFLLWTDAQGRQHSTAPSDARTALFTVPRTDDAVVVWGDVAAGSWGLVGGGLTTVREGTQTPQLQLAQHPAATSTWQGVYGLLPAGARDVEVALPAGARRDGDVQWQALEALDATAFLAVFDEGVPGATKGWVPRVTWTNADGSPGTFTPFTAPTPE